MTNRMDRLRRALKAANERADAAIGRTEARLAGRTEAGERLRAFVNRELAPALTALEQEVLGLGGDLAIIREYNDPTQYRYAIVGRRPEPNRAAFRATLSGVIGRTGQIQWTLTQGTGASQPIEDGSAQAICDAIVDAFTLAIEGQ